MFRQNPAPEVSPEIIGYSYYVCSFVSRVNETHGNAKEGHRENTVEQSIRIETKTLEELRRGFRRSMN